MHPHQVWRPVATVAALVAATLFATTTVVVEPGDTLSEIADRHGVTVAELVEWNALDDPDRIVAGATLVLAAPTDGPGDTAAAARSVHVVTAGDTLSAIARRFGVSIGRLVAANELADPDHIYAGQTLRLDPTPAPTTSTTPVRTYTVAPGDTLGAIAVRHRIDLEALAKANDIADVDRIVVGAVLVLDGTAVEPEPTAPADTTPPTTAPPTTAPPTTAPDAKGEERRAGDVLLSPLFGHWANAYDVPRDLLEAIAWKESSWQTGAAGPGDRLGLFQLRPDTVELIEGGLLGRDLDPLDAEDAVQMGARYLRYLLDRTDGEREAAAAWTQGLASVQRDGVTAVGATYADAVDEIRRERG